MIGTALDESIVRFTTHVDLDSAFGFLSLELFNRFDVIAIHIVIAVINLSFDQGSGERRFHRCWYRTARDIRK